MCGLAQMRGQERACDGVLRCFNVGQCQAMPQMRGVRKGPGPPPRSRYEDLTQTHDIVGHS